MYHYMEQEQRNANDNYKQTHKVNSGLQAFNMLIGMRKAPIGVSTLNNGILAKANLKMGHKEPKQYKCTPKPLVSAIIRPKHKPKDDDDDDDECNGNYYDGREFKRTRDLSVRDDILYILKLLSAVDHKFSEYEKHGVPIENEDGSEEEYIRSS